jgi:hypothetical protein
MPLSHSREVDPTLQRVARTRQSGDWRAMMLPEDVTHFRDRYGDVLDRWSYADWAIAPAKSDPSAGSEYIARIADEAFGALAAKAVERGLPARKSASEVDELPVAPQ